MDRVSTQDKPGIPVRLVADATLSDGAKVTYVVLLRLCRGRDRCRATNRRIAQSAGGRSAATARRHLRELERAGWITSLIDPATGWRTAILVHREPLP